MNDINIVLITDENYAMPTCVALTSMYINKKPESKYSIYLIVDNVRETSIQKIKKLAKDDFQIHILQENTTGYKDIVQKTEHVSKAALIKFRLPSLLPELDKVLYLDGDIIVQRDLSRIYDTYIEDKYAAVVKDAAPMLCYKPDIAKKLGVDLPFYFNSGVMLLNLKKMREQQMEKRLFDYRINGINFFQDQDAFNVQFGGNVRLLSVYDNYIYTINKRIDIDKLRNYYHEPIRENEMLRLKRCRIVHLASPKKPWKQEEPYYTALFLKYYDKSPYASEELILKSVNIADVDDEIVDIKKKQHKKNAAELTEENVNYNNKIKELSYGLWEGKERKTKITVSMTTFPRRIFEVEKTLVSLLDQSIKPDRVVLCLTEEEFPNGEAELPESLLSLKKYGLSILWGKENLRCHNKYYYAMQAFPDDIIITVDDDIYYEKNIVEKLYKGYERFPNVISALRTHLITFDQYGGIKRYNDWKYQYSNLIDMPSYVLCATGVGGVLYPPHILPKETFNTQNIKKLCYRADDIWLKFMELINDVPVVKVGDQVELSFVGETQQIGLCYDNVTMGGNDEFIYNMLAYYDNWNGAGDSLLSFLWHSSINENNKKIASSSDKVKKVKTINNAIERSWSYRIGLFITFIPRKIYDAIMRWKA